MNFSTVPSWILKDTATVRDSAYQRLGTYYARLLSWYEKGGFTDELGIYHASGHNYKFDYWDSNIYSRMEWYYNHHRNCDGL